MIKNISGTLVILRPLNLKDVPLFRKWVKDQEVVKWSLSKWLKKYTKKEIEEWLGETIKAKKQVTFGIVEKSTGNLIGYAGITKLSKINNSGEYFIFIGDKNSWGKGYGTEVTKLVVNYGFRRLKLHRIALTVSEPNIGAVKAYKKAGFVQEGVLREAAKRGGKYHNKLVMSILQHDFLASKQLQD